jgi:hypothetical protein
MMSVPPIGIREKAIKKHVKINQTIYPVASLPPRTTRLTMASGTASGTAM